MSSPISFNGLVSGLDTKSIIDALLQADQLPLKMLQTQQSNEQTKLKAYQDLNTKLQALQTAASTLGLESTTGAKSLSFGGPSGAFATGTATADAANGSFTLQIDQLATQTTVTSTAAIGTPVAGTDVLVGSAKTQPTITSGTFTINGHGIVVSAGETLDTLLTDINTQTGGAVTASLNASNELVLTSASNITVGSVGDTSNFLTASHLLAQPSSTTITGSAPLGVSNATEVLDSGNINGLTSTTTGLLNINGVTITYNTQADTLNDVLSRINASSAQVTAVYDPTSDTVTFKSTKTGNLDVTLSDVTGNLLSSLNVTDPTAHHLGDSAQYEINGGAPQYSLTNSVGNIQPGVNLTFQATTPSAITVTTSQNTSVGAQAIQSFVTAYNSVVDTLSQSTSYDPTTKSAGIFLGDPIIADLQQQLDSGLFISNGASLGLTPPYTSITALGLNTGPIGSSPGTTTDLAFDSGAFADALSANPAAVINTVTTIFGNLSQTLLDLTQPGGLMDAAVQSENAQIADFQDQINFQNDFISQQETFLTQEFSQLEAQLAQLQSQASVGASALSSFAAQSASSSSNSLTGQLLGNGSSSSGASSSGA